MADPAMYESRDGGWGGGTPATGLYEWQVRQREKASQYLTGSEHERQARLARWQRDTDGQRDEQQRRRQTPAARAQDARSAPGSHNSSTA